jgi:4Fe-4S ferredoxin
MAAHVLGLPSPMVEDPASEAAETRLLQGSRDPVKARRAARDPLRTGERCRAPALAWVPIVDREKCEGKQECVDVCPYSVFELGVLTDEEHAALSFTGRIKARRHDRRTARTPQAAACRACGLCVVACPEDAITLRPTTVR